MNVAMNFLTANCVPKVKLSVSVLGLTWHLRISDNIAINKDKSLKITHQASVAVYIKEIPI